MKRSPWKANRAELMAEADRLGIKDPSRYLVNELRRVVAARLAAKR